MLQTVITGTGAYIPPVVKKNEDFFSHTFYTDTHKKIETDIEVTIQKFEQITGIKQRAYAPGSMVASDMGALAAEDAIRSAKLNKESIDYIIVAHNYGDRPGCNGFGDNVPSIASKIKHHLGIKNPACIPYDLLFGCPGWLQALIQADLYIKSGNATTCLVIGTETLSRVVDIYDRDSMIFSDGAGACIVQRNNGATSQGVLASSVLSHALDTLDLIYTGPSNISSDNVGNCLKMKGHKVYNYALSNVPLAMKDCLDKSGIPIEKLKMIFLHQANEKMDAAITREFYKLYNIDVPPGNIMPMNIGWMGNNSVATIPILLHQVITKQLAGYHLQPGDIIMLASVGAGMNINAVIYQY